MSYVVKIKRSAEKELDYIHPKFCKLISSRIFSLSDNPRPIGCKKLKGNIYRIRSGDYRVVYFIDDKEKTIEIAKVGHRREVYR